MVAITFGDNLNRQQAIVSENTTVNAFIAENNFDAGGRSITLNGNTLNESQKAMTFAQLGVTERASLLAIARKDNA